MKGLRDRMATMRTHAETVRRLRARLLEQLTPREVAALDYCAAACDGGASIIEDAELFDAELGSLEPLT